MLSTLVGEYKGVLRFFKAYKRFWLVFTAVMIIISVICGALLWGYFSENSNVIADAINSVSEVFEVKSDIITNEAGVISAIGLFKNNVMATLLITILGIIPFIFSPLISLIINVVIICVTVTAGVAVGAFDAFGAFLLIAPHGIFEFPALMISAGLGIMLCTFVTSGLIGRNTLAISVDHLALELSRTFILIVVPLLIIASVTEAYLTPILFSLFI